jgi:DNA-binding SARP family transcriptional activator
VVLFRVLGRIEVRDADGEFVVVRRRKQRALLAVLLLRAGSVVRTGEIMDALWGERPPASARANVHSYVSALRQVLDRVREPAGSRLVKAASGYRLDVPESQCDAMLFAGLAAEGRRALVEDQPARAADRLGRALGLWHGPPLEDVADLDWFTSDVARLTEARLAATEDQAEARLALGEHASLVPELAAAVAAHPLRERLWALYLRALHGSGERAQALTAFANMQLILKEELGVRPSRELQALHQRIDEDVRPKMSPISVATGPAMLPPAVADFTAREEEARLLRKTLSPGSGAVGLTVAGITGMAGIGKTTLALHVAHSLAALYPDGQLYTDLAGAGTSPSAPADVLGRFLRALGLPGRAVPPDPDDRVDLYRSMMAGRRILVVLDNAASEEQVRPLLPGGTGCAVLLTSRRWLHGITGVHWTELEVLRRGEGVRLLARAVPDSRIDGDPRAAAEVVRLCGGLPLAVRVAGAWLTARPSWTLPFMTRLLRDEQRRLDRLDIGDLRVRASLTLSYNALPPSARRLFRLLGTFDIPDFPGWLAAVVSQRAPRSAAADLDALVDAHLLDTAGVDVAGQARYRFHDLVRLLARDRAQAEEQSDVLADSVRRGCAAWLAVAERLERTLPGPRYAPIGGRAVRPDVGHVLADLSSIEPISWFDAEQVTVRALIRQASRTGDDEAAFDLVQWMEKYFDVRGCTPSGRQAAGWPWSPAATTATAEARR